MSKTMTTSEIAEWCDMASTSLDTVPSPLEINLAQAAATIRAQAEALKIATEALERQKEGLVCCRDIIDCDDWIDDLTQALARIKEVV